MLQPIVSEVINDKNLKINTNPIEVYKVWVNQQESETGKTRYVTLTKDKTKFSRIYQIQ